jgi:hypothetical protein
MGRSVNWGRMSHVVPGSSWLPAHDTTMTAIRTAVRAVGRAADYLAVDRERVS